MLILTEFLFLLMWYLMVLSIFFLLSLYVYLSGLEELKIWLHIFLCMPVEVCVHVVHAANFMHVNYLVRDYVLYVNILLVLYYLTLYYIKICDSCKHNQ